MSRAPLSPAVRGLALLRSGLIWRALSLPLGGLCLGLLGCANPGPPRPPTLRLPEPVKDLHAERVGDEVVLTWTNPTRTTDGDPIRGLITPVICREASSAGERQTNAAARPAAAARTSAAAQAAPCVALRRLPASSAVAGAIRTADQLPQVLLSGPVSLLAYRIQVFNGQGRAAAPSPPAFAAAGAAPPPMSAIEAVARREGIAVTWRPAPPGPATVELHRTLDATAAGPVPAAAPPPGSRAGQTRGKSPSPGSPTQPRAAPHFLQTGPASSNQVLVAGGGPNSASSAVRADPGGLIDRSVRDLDTVTYVAQRVQTLMLGGQTVELRGVPSAPVTLTFHAVFAPSPPTGLVSIPGGGFGEPLSIDLSWEPEVEPDLSGYNVYRADSAAPDASFHLLNPQPVAASAFRDLNVEPGHTYRYAVTAVEQHGNESKRSAEVRESLRR